LFAENSNERKLSSSESTGIYKMRKAVIVAMQRTPLGKIRKALASFDPVDLGAMAAKKCVEKAGISPADIDEIIFGNLFNFNNGNIARKISLRAGFPIEVPAVHLDRRCSSSLDCAAYASMLIQSGNADIVLAGGVESYSQQPIMLKNPAMPYPCAIEPIQATSAPEPYVATNIQTAENLVKKFGITREECDEFALRSHLNAARAWNEGLFAEQVFPVEIPQKKGDPIKFEIDECVRFDASIESMAKLKPVLKDGTVTAGNASPMNDGAAAVLIMSEEKANEYGLEPLAYMTGYATAGVDPREMGYGPVPATRKLLGRMGLTFDDIDLIEINEAFAAQSLTCIKELGMPMEKINVNGGAIAIGHPNAASGAILIGRLVHEMKRRDAHRGLVTFCVGGGQGCAVMFER